jgi:hypothetical protein
MLIPIPSRNLAIAAAAARGLAQNTIAEDRKAIENKSFELLRDGAVHNGLSVTPEREKEMREMVARDVEHSMEGHPSNAVVERLSTMLAMAEYLEVCKFDDTCVVDHAEFEIIKEHLPIGK